MAMRLMSAVSDLGNLCCVFIDARRQAKLREEEARAVSS